MEGTLLSSDKYPHEPALYDFLLYQCGVFVITVPHEKIFEAAAEGFLLVAM